VSTLRCLYSCDGCGATDRVVEVPERDPDVTDVVTWVRDVVGHAIGADHRKLSPLCPSSTMAKVKIPVDAGSEHLGQKARN
jgi:hypothetical protein